MIDTLERAAKSARKGDAREALAGLLEAWRTTRAPELAEAIEAFASRAGRADDSSDFDAVVERGDVLDLGWLMEHVAEGNAAAATPRAERLGALEPDPRIASGVMRLLEDPPYHATGAKPLYTRLFKLLEANADPRNVARLKRLPKRLEKIVKGAAMRGWLVERATDVAEELKEKLGKTAPVPEDAAELLASLAEAPVAQKTRPAAPAARKGTTEADLLAAVYERPEDDGPRQVFADWLQERKDPRGEMIALQFLREQRPLSAEEQKRESSIIRKNQPAWLGELASVVDYKGYLHCGTYDRWGFPICVGYRRGFPSTVVFKWNTAKLKKLGRSPMWSTVEHASHLRSVPDSVSQREAWQQGLVALFQSMPSLRRLDFANADLLGLVALAGRADQIEHVELWTSAPSRTTTPTDVAETLAVARTLPRLVRLHLRVALEHRLDAAAVRTIASEAVSRGLAAVRIEFDNDVLELRASGGTSSAYVHAVSDSPERLVEGLDAQPICELVVTGCGADDPPEWMKGVRADHAKGERIEAAARAAGIKNVQIETKYVAGARVSL